MGLLDYLYAFIPMLGVLIFVHELGHFLVAKACGVRVLKFSLGFGPPIGFGRFRLRWERGGTEYVVAWVPLGGFVKMLGENLAVQGEDDAEAVSDAAPDEYLTAKPTWQKLAIVFAGPAMNLLLPVVAFAGWLYAGIPRPAPVVGTVELASPAAEAGVEPGDRVLAVDGEPVTWWEDVESAVRERRTGDVSLRVERNGHELLLAVPVVGREGLDEFGGVTSIGWIGLAHARLRASVAVTSADAPAARAGLRAGDTIKAVDGQEVEDFAGLARAYASSAGPLVELAVERPGTEELQTVQVPALGSLAALGVEPATVLVHDVREGLPAARAGLEAGDVILAVDGEPVGSFGRFQETVRASGGRGFEITYARDGETRTATIAPEEHALDAGGIEEKTFQIGISVIPALPGATAIEQLRNPLVALPRAVGMTWDMTAQFLRGLQKIATGEIGRDKLAGPIGIAEIARRSLDLGWQSYLYTLVLISINLGILNLLPIPVLDGGQALIFAVEGIKRSPLSMRTRELVQSLGLTVIVMLMGLAFWNDLSRNWGKLVKWLTGGA